MGNDYESYEELLCMSTPPNKGGFSSILKQSDVALTFGLFGIVMLLVLPIPAGLLDMTLALSIGISLLILLIVVYVKEPAEFSVFPTILLAVTLFRLGLNVASTRLILIDGYAGKVIETFGNTVVGGNYVVGAVVFLILVLINFLVITKGSGRIAEVAARFTLDAMPGKQMAIDAELNAGIIDETQATARRQKIQKEADFYGSMDGASKFVRGDAVAGILITLINVIGGISIGVMQKGLAMGDALQKYTLLSIGDGLVSQIPSLIVSVAAGILVTRTSDDSNLGAHMGRQLVVYPRALGIAGAMLLIFAFVPGMPMGAFMTLAVACIWISMLLKKRKASEEKEKALKKLLPSGKAQGDQERESEENEDGAKPAEPIHIKDMIHSDVFAIELSYGLVGLADRKQGGDLLDRITGLRKKLARELGMILPPISVRDNLEMETNEYGFKLRGKLVAKATLLPNRWMAMNVSNSSEQLKGVATKDPVFGLEAVWISEEERKNAEMNGFSVIDATSVLITHLSEVLKENAHRILERQDVQKLIDTVKEKNPTLISELIPDLANIGLIQRVLQNLLQERISIRHLGLVLETIADYAPTTKNPDELSEKVRKKLGVYFIEEFETEPNVIHALTLDPRIEQYLLPRVKRGTMEVSLLMDPKMTDYLLNELNARLQDMMDQGLDPTLVVTTEIRLPMKRFFEPSFPRLSMLAYQELPNQTQLQNFGIISAPSFITAPPPANVEEMKEELAEMTQ